MASQRKCIYSTAKIEEAAVHAVEGVFIPLPAIKTSFNKEDKKMLTDGTITLFSSPEFKIDTEEQELPVQIKGTTGDVGYKRQTGGHFSIGINYLRKYDKVHDGLLLFVVELNANNLQRNPI